MSRKSNLSPAWFAAIFLVVGVGLAAGAVMAEVHRARKMAGTLRATGTVVSLEHGGKSGSGSRPVVEFRTPDERLHVIRGSVYSSPPSFTQGESVEVAYHPDKPDEAMLMSFWEQHLVGLVLGILGFSFSAFGVVFMWLTLRGRLS